MCGKTFKSSAYWFQMKKTDFPDKCSACRLANRERMRAELEGTSPAATQQEESKAQNGTSQIQFAIETKEARGKHGPKKATFSTASIASVKK
jgi:hypothetical protein